jgi:hypothetical protein
MFYVLFLIYLMMIILYFSLYFHLFSPVMVPLAFSLMKYLCLEEVAQLPSIDFEPIGMNGIIVSEQDPSFMIVVTLHDLVGMGSRLHSLLQLGKFRHFKPRA